MNEGRCCLRNLPWQDQIAITTGFADASLPYEEVVSKGPTAPVRFQMARTKRKCYGIFFQGLRLLPPNSLAWLSPLALSKLVKDHISGLSIILGCFPEVVKTNRFHDHGMSVR
jgi:hypothetical protein